jgi:hypothetical protein
MKILITLAMLMTLTCAYAAPVSLEIVQFSFINTQEHYSVYFMEADKVSIFSPDGEVKVRAKVLSDSRPWDGCLEMQLEEYLFSECTHDGPSSYSLITPTGKQVELTLKLTTRLKINE